MGVFEKSDTKLKYVEKLGGKMKDFILANIFGTPKHA